MILEYFLREAKEDALGREHIKIVILSALISIVRVVILVLVVVLFVERLLSSIVQHRLLDLYFLLRGQVDFG